MITLKELDSELARVHRSRMTNEDLNMLMGWLELRVTVIPTSLSDTVVEPPNPLFYAVYLHYMHVGLHFPLHPFVYEF